MARFLVLVWLLLLSPGLWAQATVDGVRTWAGSDGGTRVVFDLSAPIEHRVFTLRNPHRVVIDFSDARIERNLLAQTQVQGLVGGVRGAQRNQSDYRLVLDLTGAAEVKSFLVKPNDTYGHRLVVDLAGPEGKAAPAPVPVRSAGPRRELVIAIDAGHGGEDPGAIGPGGTYEKHVTLAMAKRLAEMVNREPGMRAVLIRDGDHYIPLRERTRRARQYQADMFISLHADAIAHRSVRGASTYTLSRNGASTEAARLLAARENSADAIAGVSLEDKDDLVATVLLDLSRAATEESSNQLASYMLEQLGRVGNIHKKSVEQANFAVLRSLDIPSVLVELAFISNPQEERLLVSSAHQAKMAAALMTGIRQYAQTALLPGLQLAGGSGSRREHVVRRGDTLSGIANHYQVNLGRLRAVNNLASDQIRIGATLIIP